MKKNIFALFSLVFLTALSAKAATEIIGEIYPTTAASATATIAAPGNGKQNCIDFITVGTYVYGSNNAVVRVLDGGTTVYALTISTSNGISSLNPIYLVGPTEDPLCGSSNSAIRITNTATSYDINYEGFIRKTR